MALIISSFYRMRFFRFDKASLVLKLCLPFFRTEPCEDENLCDGLNSFYLALADAYRDAICDKVSGMTGKFTVSVGFTVAKDKYRNKYKKALTRSEKTAVLERYIKSNDSLEFTKALHADVVDLSTGVLLK